VTLKTWLEVRQGHWKRHRQLTSKYAVTLKTCLEVRQGHWKRHRSIERIRLPINVP